MSEKDQTTPRPWAVEDRRQAALKNIRILNVSGLEVAQVSDVHQRDPRGGKWTNEQADALDARGLANAELIVRSVNSHDALVAAARAEINRCPNCFDSNCTDAVHDQISAALALAEANQ